MKKFIVLLVLTLCVNCQLSTLETKPVEINGLGSLTALKNKSLDEDQLSRITKTVIQRRSINDEDANAMLDIYQNNIEQFYIGSFQSEIYEDPIGSKDVENYLTLILKHENLRDKVQYITFNKAEKLIETKIEFADKDSSVAGNNAGVFIKVFTNAYKTALDDDKNWQEKADNIYTWKKIILLTAFESAASNKMSGEIPATKEEKDKALQFLQDLQNFNEQLANDEKILDTNGRLINPANATEKQLTRFQNVVNGTVNSSMKDSTKAKLPASRLQITLGETANRMGIDPK